MNKARRRIAKQLRRQKKLQQKIQDRQRNALVRHEQLHTQARAVLGGKKSIGIPKQAPTAAPTAAPAPAESTLEKMTKLEDKANVGAGSGKPKRARKPVSDVAPKKSASRVKASKVSGLPPAAEKEIPNPQAKPRAKKQA